MESINSDGESNVTEFNTWLREAVGKDNALAWHSRNTSHRQNDTWKWLLKQAQRQKNCFNISNQIVK